jgi:uncharacterized protein (TIGR00369 family)
MSLFNADTVPAWANAFLQGIPYARESGMTACDVGVQKGHATVDMPARDAWTGDALTQQLHPGCATVLADTACGLAVGAALDTLVPFATLDLRMDYLRPARAGIGLSCQAHCHRVSRNVAFVRGEIYQPGTDEPVAMVSATFMLGTANQRRSTPKAAADTSPPASGTSTAAPGASHPPSANALAAATTAAAISDACAAPGLVRTPASPAGRSPYADFLALERCAPPDDPAAAVFRMPFKPELIGNPVLPALHGGVVAGFAETAALLHVIYTSDLAPEEAPRGVDFSLDYLRPARPVDTWARCTTVRQGARVALVHVQVWQEDPSRPIVTARSHCLLPAREG